MRWWCRWQSAWQPGPGPSPGPHCSPRNISFMLPSPFHLNPPMPSPPAAPSANLPIRCPSLLLAAYPSPYIDSPEYTFASVKKGDRRFPNPPLPSLAPFARPLERVHPPDPSQPALDQVCAPISRPRGRRVWWPVSRTAAGLQRPAAENNIRIRRLPRKSHLQTLIHHIPYQRPLKHISKTQKLYPHFRLYE